MAAATKSNDAIDFFTYDGLTVRESPIHEYGMVPSWNITCDNNISGLFANRHLFTGEVVASVPGLPIEDPSVQDLATHYVWALIREAHPGLTELSYHTFDASAFKGQFVPHSGIGHLGNSITDLTQQANAAFEVQFRSSTRTACLYTHIGSGFTK